MSLPSSYVEFLTSFSNGGRVEPTGPGSFPEVGLVALLGVEREDDLDIEDRIRECSDGRLPSGYIPIGDAEGGNLVCLSIGADDYGSVWFWDHEFEVPTESLVLLARTFDQFLDDLGPPAESADMPAPTEAWIDPAFLLEVEGGRNQ